MAELTNLLGGYGSGSEDEDASMEDAAGANATGLGLLGGGSPSTSGGDAAAAGEAVQPAGGPPADGDGDEPPGSPSAAAHVVGGPSTNPEPPPEGLSPPVAPAASGSDGGGVEGGMRRDDPRMLLPPELRAPPPGPVDPVIQEKVALIDTVQRQKGVTVMAQLSKDRRWTNPTFLDKMVAHFDLNPYGTCFGPEVWDPTALPESDTWPKLEEELKAAAARRAEEASRRDQLQFTSGGLQAPMAPAGGGLAPGGGRAPIGAAAAAAAAAAKAVAAASAAAGVHPSGAPRVPLSSADPRLLQAQAVAQSLAARAAGLPPAASGSKRTKWDA
ncbi:hypothetical protein Rsub_00156 [Raphidocelis subcapitata]|uniref:HCNGP-like protein n=1 Tax=Raphidocelis subcapitata TaxID=307507 RepID=A0A2V0NRJ1_9CHLO|nr:hypothetical protein Rsub_00156 [Raphidocelis subcapitata]|eukprot:GBF87445.1 hypothetical protein Rsub_00156 [Raphidocelis subcapitata]